MILILITYIAGILTILSPCILPVLPFVFARSQGSFLKSGVPLLAGMSLTFSLFSALAIVGGEWISHASEVGRIVALLLLSVFGLSLIFPEIAEKILHPLTQLGSKFGQGSSQGEGKSSFGSSFVVGIGTGLLWAPCAGPILGLVLTGAAAQGSVGASIGLLFAYSLGAATSLGIALVAGNRFLGRMKKFLGIERAVKKTLGVLVLIGVAAIVFKLDRTVLTQISKIETASLENRLLDLLPKKAEVAKVNDLMPELEGAVSWINSAPLKKSDLKGKVVLVDFWTYSCINCLRTLPYVKSWAAKYKDDNFVVIGVHTPEFAFEKSTENVQKAIAELGITYPVAVDSDYKIWNAFSNEFWPAHYFIDRAGHIRKHHFGEGNYVESEKIIQELLQEDGSKLQMANVEVQAQGALAQSNDEQNQSPETYVGYDRASNLVLNPQVMQNKEADYKFPASLDANQWSVNGKWIFNEERAVSQGQNAKIRFRFHARDLHLVLGAAAPVHFKVSIDGKAPDANHGADTDAAGQGEVKEQRLYQLIRQNSEKGIQDHIFEIEFREPGVEAYAFTFG